MTLYAKWTENIPAIVPVDSVTGVPDTIVVGVQVVLSGAVFPTAATNKSITWSVESAGPNPVSKSTGQVGFFVNAPMSKCSGTLTVYDAVGNVVRKINIAKDVSGVRRVVGSWDLKDGKGNPVSAGTYLIRGTITVNGKRELVSAVVGVR